MARTEAQAGGGSSIRPPYPIGVVERVARRLIDAWALFGGVVLFGLVAMTAASAIGNIVLHQPVPGDYEMVRHFTAIAVFTFLPFAQMIGANVTVDIFTEGAGPRMKAAMLALSSVIALGFGLLLLRQMWLGFGTYYKYEEVTATLGIPLWTAYPFILVSLVLLVAASLITLGNAWRAFRGRLVIQSQVSH